MTKQNMLMSSELYRYGMRHKWCVLGYLMFSFIVAFCFQLGDLVSTSWQGYKIWDFLAEGKLWEFYKLCDHLPGFDGAAYDPPLYIAFALWNLPLYIISKITGLSINPGIVTYWSRVMLMLFFILSSVILKDVASRLAMREGDAISSGEEAQHNAEFVFPMFMLTPFAFFAVVVLGCYDIIPILFCLLALREYLKGNLIAFAMLFGISNTFKYITFFIYIPLVLLLEKRIRNIALMFLLGGIPTLFWISLKRMMPGMEAQMGLHNSIISKFSAWSFSTGHSVTANVFFIGYFVLCFFAYSLKPTSKEMKGRWMAFMPLMTFSWLFVAIAPNPQWTVFLAPFLVLNLCLNPDHKDALLWAEACAFVGFTGMCFVSTNTDEQLIDVCSALAYVFHFNKLYNNFRFDTGAITSSIECLPSILLSLYIAALAAFNFLSAPIGKLHLTDGAAITRKEMLLRFCVIFVFIIPVAVCYSLSYLFR